MIIEEIENGYTMGNINYPKYTVNSYRLLNYYKQLNPMKTSPPAYGVVFSQRSTNRSKYLNNDKFQQSVTHHEC